MSHCWKSHVVAHLGFETIKPVFGVCEQQRHRPARMVSAFVIRMLTNIICTLATSELTLFWLFSVAKGDWFESHRRQVVSRRDPFPLNIYFYIGKTQLQVCIGLTFTDLTPD